MKTLSQKEKDRYNRHLILDEISEKGQEKLKNSRVLIVGCGGLGSPIALYLAAAGIGTIGLIDRDVVSESNLQRQILYRSEQVGALKVQIAKQELLRLNPHISVDAYTDFLTEENAKQIIENYDIILDATDNLKVRYLIDEWCHKLDKPMIYGSICEFKGQISIFNTMGASRYADLYPYESESVENFSQPLGVVGALPGVVGAIQASECVKFILGKASLVGKLLLIDLMKNEFITLEL